MKRRSHLQGTSRPITIKNVVREGHASVTKWCVCLCAVLISACEKQGPELDLEPRPVGNAYQVGGKEFLIVKADEVRLFSEGLAPGRIGQKWGYLDLRGRWVIDPRYEEVTVFREGLAFAKEGGLFGIIDRSGRWLVAPRFASCMFFAEGVAAVLDGEEWGFVGSNGRHVFGARFASAASAFSDGMACVEPVAGKGWGFIDHSGTLVIGAKFDGPVLFHRGAARVRENGREYVINLRGDRVDSP